MLLLAITEANMERGDEIIRVTKERFKIGPPKGFKVIEIYVGMGCPETVWILEAESEADVFRWFSPLQPYYFIKSIRPAMRRADLYELFDRELGDLVAKVQHPAVKK